MRLIRISHVIHLIVHLPEITLLTGSFSLYNKTLHHFRTWHFLKTSRQKEDTRIQIIIWCNQQKNSFSPRIPNRILAGN